jgi:hypothetical protein
VRNLFTNPFDKDVEPIFFYNYIMNEVAINLCKIFIENKEGKLGWLVFVS